MRKAEAFSRGIDTINEWVSKTASWLIIPMTFIVSVDAILRYALNKPTIWAWDVNVQLLGVLAILGAGYALRHGSHVGVDILVARLSPRKRAILDLITFMFFFIGIGALLWKTGLGAWNSLQMREPYTSYLSPPIYPFKIIMVVGVLLLLLQGIAKFLRDLAKVTSPLGDKQ